MSAVVDVAGQIPENWEVKRLEHLSRARRHQVAPEEMTGRSVLHYSIPAVQEAGTGKVEEGSSIDSGKLLISEECVLVSKLNPRKGTVCIARPDPELLTVCSSEFVPLTTGRHSIRYLYYVCLSTAFRQHLEMRVQSATKSHQRVQPSDVLKAQWAFPPLDQQKAIAEFLDREIEQIDAVVDAQERLVELLTERRRAAILSAVTHGLDPLVALSSEPTDSGERYPAHWDLLPLKAMGRTQSGAGFPHDEQGVDGQPLPFYKVNALGRADIDGVVRMKYDTIDYQTAARLRAAVIPAGSLIMAKIGAALLLGRIRMLAYDSCIDNNMLGFIPADRADARFVFYALQQLDLAQLVNPGAVPSLSDRVLRNFRVAWPSIEEQREIANWLGQSTGTTDAMIAKAKESIALMRERGAALISAAVTGQIDLRRRPRQMHDGVLEEAMD